MANLTIVVDDQLLKAARVKAVQEGTSVNEVCRQAIARYTQAGNDDVQARLERVERIRAIAAIAAKSIPPKGGGPLWPGREALYEEVLRERGLLKNAPARKRPATKR